MDRIDRKILRLLQEDAERPLSEIAEAVGLSQAVRDGLESAGIAVKQFTGDPL